MIFCSFFSVFPISTRFQTVLNIPPTLLAGSGRTVGFVPCRLRALSFFFFLGLFYLLLSAQRRCQSVRSQGVDVLVREQLRERNGSTSPFLSRLTVFLKYRECDGELLCGSFFSVFFSLSFLISCIFNCRRSWREERIRQLFFFCLHPLCARAYQRTAEWVFIIAYEFGCVEIKYNSKKFLSRQHSRLREKKRNSQGGGVFTRVKLEKTPLLIASISPASHLPHFGSVNGA
jgi:hypothetical protein